MAYEIDTLEERERNRGSSRKAVSKLIRNSTPIHILLYILSALMEREKKEGEKREEEKRKEEKREKDGEIKGLAQFLLSLSLSSVTSGQKSTSQPLET
jgi:hypothetical protein